MLIFFGAVGLLFVLNLLTTNYIGIGEESNFQRDVILVNIAWLIVFGIILFMAYRSRFLQKITKRINTDESYFKKLKDRCLLIVLGISCLLVLCVRCIPQADQFLVVDAASKLHLGDSSVFEKGGYVEKFPQQRGIILCMYLLSFLVGDYNYLVFQLINVFVLMFLVKQLMELTQIFGGTNTQSFLTGAACILFFPLFFYTTFVYGNLSSICCCLAAMKYELLYFQERKKRQAFLSFLLIVAGILIKSNSLIFMIAMLLYAIAQMVEKRRLVGLGFCVAVLLGCMLQGKVTQAVIEAKTGEDLSGGASSVAWAAMGMQDKNSWCYGWYNGYVDHSYEACNFDTEKQAAMCKENLRGMLQYYKRHPKHFASFLGIKIMSQWTNPTFQGDWVMRVCDTEQAPSVVTQYLTSPKGCYLLTRCVKGMVLVIWFGTICFLLTGGWKAGGKKIHIFCVTFVGGFLFHTVWEAKCQYTVPYFLLLFPIAVLGYRNALAAAEQKFLKCREVSRGDDPSEKKQMRSRQVAAGICSLVLLIAIGGFQTRWSQNKSPWFQKYEDNIFSKKLTLDRIWPRTLPRNIREDGTFRLRAYVRNATPDSMLVVHGVEQKTQSAGSFLYADVPIKLVSSFTEVYVRDKKRKEYTDKIAFSNYEAPEKKKQALSYEIPKD